MPDAPDPTYNRNGTLMTDWLVVVRYDAPRDVLTLSWTRDGDLYRPTSQGAIAHPQDAVQALLEDTTSTIRRLHAPRLF